MAIEQHRLLSGYLPLRDAMNLLLERSVIAPESVVRHGIRPPVDVVVTDDDVVVEMALPGGNPDDVSISVTGESLVISGAVTRHHGNETGRLYLHEIWHGAFQRTLRLPVQVDPRHADASFVDGILTLRLPKSEAAKRHTIHIGRQPQSITREADLATGNGAHEDAVATPPTEVQVRYHKNHEPASQ